MNKSEEKKGEREKNQNGNSNLFELTDKGGDKESPYYLNSGNIQYRSQYDIGNQKRISKEKHSYQ